ncbi:MAG: hypothetical protein HY510_00095, partial [Acidobacteria bacterium]|nr:hypothetical protein [Acidobacteriota bacterium]
MRVSIDPKEIVERVLQESAIRRPVAIAEVEQPAADDRPHRPGLEIDGAHAADLAVGDHDPVVAGVGDEQAIPGVVQLPGEAQERPVRPRIGRRVEGAAGQDPFLPRLAQERLDRSTGRRMFCGSFSEMNLAEWTPMTTTGSAAKRSSTRRSTGRACMQLM